MLHVYLSCGYNSTHLCPSPALSKSSLLCRRVGGPAGPGREHANVPGHAGAAAAVLGEHHAGRVGAGGWQRCALPGLVYKLRKVAMLKNLSVAIIYAFRSANHYCYNCPFTHFLQDLHVCIVHATCSYRHCFNVQVAWAGWCTCCYPACPAAHWRGCHLACACSSAASHSTSGRSICRLWQMCRAQTKNDANEWCGD